MRCSNCGTDNPEAARVCRGCAQLLEGPTVNLPSLPHSPYAVRSRLLTRVIVAGTVGLIFFSSIFLAISAIPK